MPALAETAKHAAWATACAAHRARQEEDQRSKEEQRSNDRQEQLSNDGTADIDIEFNAFLAEFGVVRIHGARIKKNSDRRWVLVLGDAGHAAGLEFGDRLRLRDFHGTSDLAFLGIGDELRPRDFHSGRAA